MGVLGKVRDAAFGIAGRAVSAGSGAVRKASDIVHRDAVLDDSVRMPETRRADTDTEDCIETDTVLHTPPEQTSSQAMPEHVQTDTRDGDTDAYSLDLQFTTNKQKRHSWE